MKTPDYAIGDRVVVRDAYNHLRPAVVRPVPRQWRERDGGDVVTSRGGRGGPGFRKSWVQIVGQHETTPWPVEDIFTDAQDAKARAEEVARRDALGGDSK